MSNLYIVSTPIGNLQDITLRAAKTLLETEILIAESTSKAGTLLEFLKKQFPEIKFADKKIISLTEDEEVLKIPKVVELIKQFDSCLISEAGTPLVSDPGFKLVREAIKHGINCVPLPGAAAPIAALAASGLPSDKFFFIGFLPKGNSKKVELLTSLKNLQIKTTVIAFESPDRVHETLKIISENIGNVTIVIARELTKIHEEFTRGNVQELIQKLDKKTIKGEVTLLFENKF